jgi:hypothetical protein
MMARFARLDEERVRPALFSVIAVLLLGAVVGLVTRGDSQPSTHAPRAETTKTPGPTATSQPPPPRSLRGGAATVAFAGSARSVETDVPVRDLGAVTTDASRWEIEFAEVTTVDGHDLGRGVLTLTGRGAGLRNNTNSLTMRGYLRIVDGAVRIAEGSVVTSTARVQAFGTLLFAPYAASPAPNGPPTSTPPTTAPPVAVAPGAVVTMGSKGASVSAGTWRDAPERLPLRGDGHRRDLSWAGAGQVTGDISYRSTFTGLRLIDVDGLVERQGNTSLVHGRAAVVQAYRDGFPQLRTTVSVGQLEDGGGFWRNPAVLDVPAGARGRFVWAPRNTGVADMNVLRIGPGNAEGGWVSLALETAPPMWGGEPHAGVGGDTTGLQNRGSGGLFSSSKAVPIDATLMAGKADRREVAFWVPSDASRGPHTMVLVIEGNFAPVRVEISIRVT